MRTLLAALTLLTATAQADVGIDAVGVLSYDLGYDVAGYGVQIDADYRHKKWGIDGQYTFLNHAKRRALGRRHQGVIMGRRHFNRFFIEAGVEYGGYESEFPNGSVWKKYGWAPGVGIGRLHNGTEWTLRYFTPDSTPNKTSVIAGSVEYPLTGQGVIGATAERWLFDFKGDRLSGTQIMFELGWRF